MMSVSLKSRISAELPEGVRKCRMPLGAKNHVLSILWETSITAIDPHAPPTVLWDPDVWWYRYHGCGPSQRSECWGEDGRLSTPVNNQKGHFINHNSVCAAQIWHQTSYRRPAMAYFRRHPGVTPELSGLDGCTLCILRSRVYVPCYIKGAAP